MKIITYTIILLLFGCTYSANNGVNINQCENVKRSCTQGVYDEWVQQNGEVSCTCNVL